MHMDASTADAMVRRLGADQAMAVADEIRRYEREHIECELIGADVINHGGGNIEVKVRHQPGCPATVEA